MIQSSWYTPIFNIQVIPAEPLSKMPKRWFLVTFRKYSAVLVDKMVLPYRVSLKKNNCYWGLLNIVIAYITLCTKVSVYWTVFTPTLAWANWNWLILFPLKVRYYIFNNNFSISYCGDVKVHIMHNWSLHIII